MGVLAMGAILVAALYALIDLRFSSGDIYPPYSSFRADPMGSKILYRSLEAMPGIAVSRQIRDWDGGRDGMDCAALFLGCGRYDLSGPLSDGWEHFIESGGRMVMALSPDVLGARRLDEPDDDSSEDEPEGEPDDMDRIEEEPSPLGDGYRIRFFEDEEPSSSLAEGGGTQIPWHGRGYFDELSPEWTVLYRMNEEPVAIEREWGEGSVVLMSDSYLFSNESMVLDRHVAALDRLIGASSWIVFDEMHLGVVSSEGVMMLAARYRLRGVLAALLVVAALFVWQRMSSFVPRFPDAGGDDNTVGAWVDSSRGFVNLLERRIAPRQLPKAMLDEWDGTFGNDPRTRKKSDAMFEAYRQFTKDTAKPDPVAVYNHLLEVFKERK